MLTYKQFIKEANEPKLIPALKHKETNKIHRGIHGQSHSDIQIKNNIPNKDEFKYERGFINHKGHFLDRDKAADYAEKHGLLSDRAKHDMIGKTGFRYGLMSHNLTEQSEPEKQQIRLYCKKNGKLIYSHMRKKKQKKS